MNRRSLLAAVAGAPFAQMAQAATRPIGWISIEPKEAISDFQSAFKLGLASAFPPGAAPAVLDRYSDPNQTAVSACVDDLQRQGVSLVVAQGGASPFVVKAKPDVPVVFAYSGDPVMAGLVESLARPGGNATGMSFLAIELNPKRIGLARDVVPGCSRVALLSNARHPGEEREIVACQQAVERLGIDLTVYRVQSTAEAATAAGQALEKRAQAALLLPSAGMLAHMPSLVRIFGERKVPVLGAWAIFSRRGATLSYGPNLHQGFRQVAGYVARILAGAPPSSLPVELPSTFELVLNRRTAGDLGLTFSPTLLAQADEVIE